MFSFTPQQQPQQTSLFQTQQQQQPSPFSQFSLTPQQQQQSPFSFQSLQQPQAQQQQQLQPQQQQPQQQLYLFTNDKTPATYSTKWADLHPDSQKVLHQIEGRILEYRDESQWLDQSSRLYDSSVFNGGFELDASRIVQELGGISTTMERQRAICQELMSVVKDMLRNTEVAVRSYVMLRPRFLRSNLSASAGATATSQGSGAIVSQTTSGQTSAIVPVFDFYSGLPKKPSPFLQETVARFEKEIAECRQWIEELEQLVLLFSEKNSLTSSSTLLQSLPKVMANVHDYFVHVAAKCESIHQYIESMKTAYLADQRRRGDGNDPFIEADRREIAKKEADARRVHPSLHLPQVSQPSTQVTGLLSSSGMPAAATATAPLGSAAVSTASSGSGFSSFNIPSTPVPASSLFSTPAPSATTSLFSTSGSSSQLALFGPKPSSTPAIGGGPLFPSTPASGVSAFMPPSASGAATGSGSSFNTSKSRAKGRMGRR